MQYAPSPKADALANAAAFAAGLQDEKNALAAFTDMLLAEQEALVQGDADQLGKLAGDKAAQLELLTHLGESRNRQLATQNLNPNAEGMLAWINRNPGFATAVRKMWKDLLAQAEKAQQINQSNGVLIETRLQQNRMQLAVLQTAAAPDGVYRPDGQLRPLRAGRYLSSV